MPRSGGTHGTHVAFPIQVSITLLPGRWLLTLERLKRRRTTEGGNQQHENANE